MITFKFLSLAKFESLKLTKDVKFGLLKSLIGLFVATSFIK